MKFGSIFKSITFIFALFVAFAIAVLVAILKIEPYIYSKLLHERFLTASYQAQLYLNELISLPEFAANLAKQHIRIIPPSAELNATLTAQNELESLPLYIEDAHIYKNGSQFLLAFADNAQQVVLADDEQNRGFFEFIKLAFVAIIVLMFFFYFYVILKLRPIRALRREVVKFADGEFNVKNLARGDDEISTIAQAFYDAATQLQNVTDSRRLFLRNCLHEIKTPITKGRLICEMISDERLKSRLEGIFKRMESLVQEFVVVEKAKTMFDKNNVQKFAALNVLENAIDLAMVERTAVSVTPNADAQIYCDFELLSIAFKNLIDNAVKYSTQGKPKVVINAGDIVFINKGARLECDLARYEQPFLKGENSKNGFGLGLYIITNIIAAHGFGLDYSHKNNTNVFIISFAAANAAFEASRKRVGGELAAVAG